MANEQQQQPNRAHHMKFVRLLIIGIPALFLIAAVFSFLGFQPMGGHNRLSLTTSSSDGYMAMGGADMAQTAPAFYAKDAMMVTSEIAPLPPYPAAPAGTPSMPRDRKIIQNGSLALMVEDIAASVERVKTIATANNGFVESVYVNTANTQTPDATLTLRVPAADFAQVVANLKGIALVVENEYASASDVSAQYVDLEAQLSNYQNEEKQYSAIMDDAKRVEDVLKVAERLADVRGRIERIQGEINFLSRQVDMSTITVTLKTVLTVGSTGDWQPILVAKNAFGMLVQGLKNFINMLIAFAILSLLALVYIIFYGLIIYVLVRFISWIYLRITGRAMPSFFHRPK